MSRRILVALVALGALLLAAAGWWFLRSPEAAAVKVQPGPLVRTLQFSARVATASRVDVGATLTGRVLQVAVAEGAVVRQGALLVQLETAELQAALSQALASEQQAAARLAGLRSTGRSSAQAGVAQADSVLRAAQADWQRTQDLVAQGFLSPSRLDEARRTLAVAQAQAVAAGAQGAANAEQGTDTAQAQAQLALAQAATQAARARLAQAEVRAPADGRVLTRAVEPGQIVQPGRALFTLALQGPLQLVAPVDERYLQQLQVGQAARVRADAFPAQAFDAQVLSLAPLVDAQRGSVDVKFAVAQPPAYLREDMTLSVEVQTGRRDRALVVPVAALRHAAGAAESARGTLWLAVDGRVQARAVTLGLRTLESVEVTEGLAAGDTVLVGEAPEPGARVSPRFDAPAAPAGKAAAGPTGDNGAGAMGAAMGR
jgi:HlyD family secretion protein